MSDQHQTLLDRTLRSFRLAWRLAGGRTSLRDTVGPSLDAGLDDVRAQIDACLDGRGGDVSTRARAAELGETYLVLNTDGRRRFLHLLAEEYDVKAADVDAAIETRQRATDATGRRRAEQALREALVPPRVRLLSQFNGLRQGVKFLVDLRAELIELAREDPQLHVLDGEVRDLLASWFDIGFLQLTRITWGTPAALLEKLIAYEAVHAVRSWEDLKKRLGSDRRCYAFFHPNMPDEPLIFVQVALVTGLADNVQVLLDEHAPATAPERADSAIFYSISNCQLGLAGVGFGDFLIKRVADDLSRDWPNLKTFATLSPIPGLGAWLATLDNTRLTALLGEADLQRLERLADTQDDSNPLGVLLANEHWRSDETLVDALQAPLLTLAAHYLLNEKRNGHALDRVAHFHLTNGARVERLNWRADTSERGLAQSAGMMVNYRYQLDDVEKNHEAYTGSGRVTAAAAVRKLARRS